MKEVGPCMQKLLLESKSRMITLDNSNSFKRSKPSSTTRNTNIDEESTKEIIDKLTNAFFQTECGDFIINTKKILNKRKNKYALPINSQKNIVKNPPLKLIAIKPFRLTKSIKDKPEQKKRLSIFSYLISERSIQTTNSSKINQQKKKNAPYVIMHNRNKHNPKQTLEMEFVTKTEEYDTIYYTQTKNKTIKSKHRHISFC